MIEGNNTADKLQAIKSKVDNKPIIPDIIE